ncbi:MAG: helix-turn-helix transcriptional regulator [Lachnospiraceae bacterium]|nr:helix-turn-helix transcriptional regulator [Lachnospiraceae bacterium]
MLKSKYGELAPRYELISKAIDVRLKKKMTQEKVAQKMGTTKSSISKFESGDYNHTVDFLIRLSGALGKTLKINMV